MNNKLIPLKFNDDLIGGSNNNLAVEITYDDIQKKIYGKDKIDIDIKQEHYCPDNFPFLCNINSKAMGLCRETEAKCNLTIVPGKPNIVPEPFEKKTINDDTKIFFYESDNYGKSCFKWHLLYEKKFSNPQDLRNNISILTMNLWGLSVNDMVKFSFMQQRMEKINEIINKEQPDIVCFQEMSNSSFNFLNPLVSNEYKRSEDQFLSDYEIKKQRNRDVDLFSYFKYEPKTVKIYSVGGVLNFEYGVMVIEYKNLVIFNVYLQSGSGYSPGQEGDFNTIHYSRCRREQYEMLKEQINEYSDKKIIVCGDFNIHLDGTYNEWPEKKELDSINLIDTFRILNPDAEGFTEDTKNNSMRFNIKLKDKQFRFDGIFVKDLIPKESYIIGKEYAFDLNSEQVEIVKEYLTKVGKQDKFDLIRYKNSENIIIEWFPSDHFGVLTKLSIS